MKNSTPLRLGLAGFGTVGSGLVHIIEGSRETIMARTGRDIRIAAILVRDTGRPRQTPLPEGAILTTSMDDLVANPDIDVVVEMMGGTDAAAVLVEKALLAGKHVVTANKALLAESGNRFFALAAEKKLHLGFEASVCGGIPIVETIKTSLAANNIISLAGILNGTSNYILSEMTTKGLSFEEALQGAREKGYAEDDPTLDVEGIDAAHKLALLIRLCWGVEYPFEQLPVKGISSVAKVDIDSARTFGYRIKLIAQAKVHGDALEAAVFPAFVHESYLISKVGGAYNAVRIHGDASGVIFLHGKGAGDLPTGSSVAADVLAIARGATPNLLGYTSLPGLAKTLPREQVASPFYIRLLLTDQPGVLRDVTSVMADNNISIAQAVQKGTSDAPHKGLAGGQGKGAEIACITLLTHEASLVNVEKALAALAATSFVHEAPVCYRVLAPQQN